MRRLFSFHFLGVFFLLFIETRSFSNKASALFRRNVPTKDIPSSLARHLFGFFGDGDDEKSGKKKQRKQNKSDSTVSSDTMSQRPQSRQGATGMGGTATMMENFKKAQQVGKRTAALSEELSSTTITGSAPGGKVKVFVNGQQRPKGIEIDDSYLKDVSPEDLVADVTAAMQDAHAKSSEHMNKKMQAFYSELGLPSTPPG